MKLVALWFVQDSYENLINENVKAKQSLMMAAAVSIRTLCDQKIWEITGSEINGNGPDISNSFLRDPRVDCNH